MPRSASVRTRVAASVASMVLPLLGVSVAAVLALDGTLERFAETADEAVEEALPLANLQALVLSVERSGLSAVLGLELTGREQYEVAQERMEEAFSELERGG